MVFEGKKLYENQVGQWITRVLQAKKYSIEPKASAMLVEFLGTSLEKINNELEKLQIILPVGSTISANDIEENIGFSKDYNIFGYNPLYWNLLGFERYSCYRLTTNDPSCHRLYLHLVFKKK